MSADLAVTTAEFDSKVLQSDVPVLVDFWAEWCGPCKAIAPHVEALAQEYSGKAKVYKVDVDQDPDIAVRFGVMNIPTLLLFKGGQVVDHMVGAEPKQKIAAMLDRALAST
ncbi:MAG: thioredoxin [Armatimonadota bacterium]